MTPKLISACRPDNSKPIYVIGGLSYRVSLHTQQRRALALVAQLATELEKWNSVAFIGGGLAGMMGAAAASAFNVDVAIYERAGTLMPVQMASSHRYLHPNVVSWPTSENDRLVSPATDLPFLNWSAGYSQRVARALVAEFDREFVNSSEAGFDVNLNNNVDSIQVIDENSRQQVRVRASDIDSGSKSESDYDAVFVTIGFGSEKKLSGYDALSYWEGCAVPPFVGPDRKTHVTIFGAGDGGIIETLSLFWDSYRFDLVFNLMASNWIDDATRQRLYQIEDNARKSPEDPYLQEQHEDFYLTINISPNGQKYLNRHILHYHDVVIVTLGKTLFSINASPLHKILLSFLVRNRYIVHQSGKIKDIKYDNYGSAGEYKITIENIFNGTEERWGTSRIKERVGPQNELPQLVQNAFAPDKLDVFKAENTAPEKELNPSSADDISSVFGSLFSDLLGDKARAASDDLREYLRIRFGSDSVAAVGSERVSVDGGDTFQLIVSYAGSDGNKVKNNGPKEFFGFSVLYQVRGFADAATSGEQNNYTGFSSTNDVKRSLTHIIRSGDQIRNLSKAGAPIGRLLAGVTFADENDELHPVRQVLALRHVVLGNSGDKVAYWDGDHWDAFGAVSGSLHQKRIVRARLRDQFTPVSDIQIIDLYRTAQFAETRIAELEDLTTYYLAGGAKVIDGTGQALGDIRRVFESVTLQDEHLGSINSQVFTCRKAPTFSNIPGPKSGTAVFSSHGSLLGFIIGQGRTDFYCIEADYIERSIGGKLVL